MNKLLILSFVTYVTSSQPVNIKFVVQNPNEFQIILPESKTVNSFSIQAVHGKTDEEDEPTQSDFIVNDHSIRVFGNKFNLIKGSNINYTIGYTDDKMIKALTGTYVFDGDYQNFRRTRHVERSSRENSLFDSNESDGSMPYRYHHRDEHHPPYHGPLPPMHRFRPMGPDFERYPPPFANPGPHHFPVIPPHRPSFRGHHGHHHNHECKSWEEDDKSGFDPIETTSKRAHTTRRTTTLPKTTETTTILPDFDIDIRFSDD